MAFPVGSQIQDMVQQKLKLSLIALHTGGQGSPSHTPHTVQAACTSNMPEKVQRGTEHLLELLSLKEPPPHIQYSLQKRPSKM